MSFIEPTEETQASHHRNTIYVAGNLTGGRSRGHLTSLKLFQFNSNCLLLSKYKNIRICTKFFSGSLMTPKNLELTFAGDLPLCDQKYMRHVRWH